MYLVILKGLVTSFRIFPITGKKCYHFHGWNSKCWVPVLGFRVIHLSPDKHCAPTAIGTKYHTAPGCWHGGNCSQQMFAVSETSGGGEFTAPKNIQKGTDWVKPDTKQEEQPQSPGEGAFPSFIGSHHEWAGAESQCSALPLKGSLKQIPPPHFGSSLMSPKLGDTMLKSKEKLNKFSARTVLTRRPRCCRSGAPTDRPQRTRGLQSMLTANNFTSENFRVWSFFFFYL